jgi:hypothetical protein
MILPSGRTLSMHSQFSTTLLELVRDVSKLHQHKRMHACHVESTFESRYIKVSITTTDMTTDFVAAIDYFFSNKGLRKIIAGSGISKELETDKARLTAKAGTGTQHKRV